MNTQNNKKSAASTGAALFVEKDKLISVSEKTTFIVSGIIFAVFLAVGTLVFFFSENLFRLKYHFIDILFAVVSVILLVVIHELFHYIGFLLSKVKSQEIIFKFNLKKGYVCCHCKKSVPLSSYRFALILPFLMTGLLPYIISIIFLNLVYTFAASLSLSICSADLIIFFKSTKYNRKVLVADHPDEPGFYIKTHKNSDTSYIQDEKVKDGFQK